MILKRTVVFCWVCVLMPGFTNAVSDHLAICNVGLKIPKHVHAGDESETRKGNGNINNRSLSAWNWIPHHSAHRIPRVMFEAECQSHHCVYHSVHRHTELNSVLIYTNTLVLTQDPRNRKCFSVNFLRVTVGCTCTWAKSSA